MCTRESWQVEDAEGDPVPPPVQGGPSLVPCCTTSFGERKDECLEGVLRAGLPQQAHEHEVVRSLGRRGTILEARLWEINRPQPCYRGKTVRPNAQMLLLAARTQAVEDRQRQGRLPEALVLGSPVVSWIRADYIIRRPISLHSTCRHQHTHPQTVKPRPSPWPGPPLVQNTRAAEDVNANANVNLHFRR